MVDIVDTFRLQVSCHLIVTLSFFFFGFLRPKMTYVLCCLQEQPAFDKKQFVTYMKRYIKLLTPKLEGEKQEEFKKNIEGATKFLLSKLSDLQL